MSPEMEERIFRELQNMRKDVVEIKIIVEELGYDLQEVRPEYIEKLKKIQKGKHIKIGSIKDFKKRYGLK